MPLSDAIRVIPLKWNLANGRITAPSPVTLTRGEQVAFIVRAVRGTTPTPLPAGTALRATLRLKEHFDDGLLLQFVDFDPVGDEADAIYSRTKAIEGDAIDAALALDSEEGNDLDQVQCRLTLSILNGSTLVAISQRLKITLFAAADGDDEGPDSVLTTQGGDFLLTQSGNYLAFH